MSVSALIVAYNHEPYVAQAIESALMQKLPESYEIVISEDCSTDGTREIVQRYADEYPDRIRTLLSTETLGGVKNFVDAFHRCTGDYVALLDGDDYWLSPVKLAKQVRFLSAHPECSMCVHGVYEIFEGDDRDPVPWLPSDVSEIATLHQLLRENFVHTSTAMLRRGTFDDFPKWVYEFSLSDFPLWVQVAGHGDIGFIHELLSAYRVHGSGVWSGRDELFQVEQLVQLHEKIRAEVDPSYHAVISRTIAKFRSRLLCVRARIPNDAIVLVVSGGEPELLKIGRPARHFLARREVDATRDLVAEQLEQERQSGAQFILIPTTSLIPDPARQAIIRSLRGTCTERWRDENGVLLELAPSH